jgi:hypothetical protein
MNQKYSVIQKLAFVYAVMFVLVAAMSYIPALKDDQGYMFGLFSLQWYDDALHLASGIWAFIAGMYSTRAAINYFKLFGFLYFLDAVLGLLFGNGILDLGIILQGPIQLDLATRIGANAPHVLIGGLALIIGFVISRRFQNN